MHAFIQLLVNLSNLDTNLIWNNRGDADEDVTIAQMLRILAFQIKCGKAPLPV